MTFQIPEVVTPSAYVAVAVVSCACLASSVHVGKRPAALLKTQSTPRSLVGGEIGFGSKNASSVIHESLVDMIRTLNGEKVMTHVMDCASLNQVAAHDGRLPSYRGWG